MAGVYNLDWRALGGKKRGIGWRFTSPRRARNEWALDVARIEWSTETFFRVGLMVQRRGWLTEVEHLRFADELSAWRAVEWLLAVADDEAEADRITYRDRLFKETARG